MEQTICLKESSILIADNILRLKISFFQFYELDEMRFFVRNHKLSPYFPLIRTRDAVKPANGDKTVL